MYNLFLETRAAAQIRLWCELNAKNEQERDAFLLAAYTNACNADLNKKHPGGFEGRLFSKCVKEDDHYRIDIDACFVWANTPEGQGFWAKVHKVFVPIPKRPL